MPEDQFQDDPTIPDDAILIRRVPYDRWKVEEHCPDTSAFNLRKSKNEKYLSVYLKGEVSLKDVIAEYPGEGVPGIVAIRVGDVRALGLGFTIRREPEGSTLPGHCGIFGSFSKGHRKQLRRISETISPPTT